MRNLNNMMVVGGNGGFIALIWSKKRENYFTMDFWFIVGGKIEENFSRSFEIVIL